MKLLLGVLITLSSIFASEYMAQIKPYEKIEVKSEISGVIEFVDKKLESNFINMKKTLLEINSKDEEIELQKIKNSLVVQREIVKLNKRNFTAKNRISQMSRYEKDNEKLNYLESKKELVSLEEEIKRLENELSKKIFKVENRYIHEVYVKTGEYVTLGDRLFDMYDISKQKITLYLKIEELESLDRKKIYIDGKVSDFKVYKISKIKDEVRVSRYKVEFIKENKKLENYFFDKIVKVQLN